MRTAATTRDTTIKITAGPRGWVKKIGGRVRWLAPIDNPELAKQRAIKYMAEHQAGITPQPARDKVVLSDVCDLFLAFKESERNSGAIRPRTFAEYFAYVQDCSDFFGANAVIASLAPSDWQRYRVSIASRFKDRHSQLRRMTVIRMMSGWADRNEVCRPFRFGDSFDPPNAKTMRGAKKAAGKRLFTPTQVKMILKAAPQPIRCMFLLALNAGFGNTDLASLPISAINLKDGVIEFDRPKTGAERKCPLWPETVADLRKIVTARNGTDSDLLFLTPKGHPLVRERYNDDGTIKSNTDAVGMMFSRTLRSINAKIKDEKKRIRRSFYDGRRTFRTIADELRDANAADLIMGHAPDTGDMGRHYVQDISIKRLRAVTDHVRSSLLGAGQRNASGRSGDKASRQGAARRKQS